MLFLILAWRTRVPRVSDILLSSTWNTGFDSSARYEPCQTTDFSSRFFRRRGEGATSVLGPQAIIWLRPSSPPWSGDFVWATRCHPSQVTVNSNSSHPTSIVSVGYHVTQPTPLFCCILSNSMSFHQLLRLLLFSTSKSDTRLYSPASVGTWNRSVPCTLAHLHVLSWRGVS